MEMKNGWTDTRVFRICKFLEFGKRKSDGQDFVKFLVEWTQRDGSVGNALCWAWNYWAEYAGGLAEGELVRITFEIKKKSYPNKRNGYDNVFELSVDRMEEVV